MPIFGDEFIAQFQLRLMAFMQWIVQQIPLVVIVGAILAFLITVQQVILSLIHGLL